MDYKDLMPDEILNDSAKNVKLAVEFDVANIIIAQLLFLASVDPKTDISLYINTPGENVSSGLAIYDTMQLIEPDATSHLYRHGGINGLSITLCRTERQTLSSSSFPCFDSSTSWRC